MGQTNPGVETSTMLIGRLSPSSLDQVDYSLDVSVRAEVDVDIPDTASLVLREGDVDVDIPDTASLVLREGDIETGSFNTEPQEGQETSLGVANDDSGVSSQPSQQPSRPAEPALAENEPQNPDLKTEYKVAILVIMISSGAMVAALGSEKVKRNHKVLVKAFSILNYISLVLGVGLFVLTLTRPNIPCLVKIAKLIMWIDIGSTTYALCCATSLLLPKLVEVVIVLVIPLVMFCLIAALSCGGWN